MFYCYVPLLCWQAELGLNATHEQQVLCFLEFSKGKRAQCLKDVETAFSELVESRLVDDTFTSKVQKSAIFCNMFVARQCC